MVERADELLYAEIAEHRRRPDLAERDDILSMLLTARFDDGSAMEDREVRDQLMTLLLAGHETTATGLAWTFDLLLHHPDALVRLRGRARRRRARVPRRRGRGVPARPPGRPVHGPAAAEDAELGGYHMPAGTTILVGIYLAHSRDDVYPDPHAFRPERMLEEGAPETYSWIPFGGGTRRCIGAAFAQMEMRIAIETILRSVKLAPPRPSSRSRCAATSPCRRRTGRG